MFGAIYSVIICAAIHVGGLHAIWEIARDGGRLNFFKYNSKYSQCANLQFNYVIFLMPCNFSVLI